MGFTDGASGEEPPANARDIREFPSLGVEDSPEGGHGNPLQYSCLENPMDRGAWQATVYRVTKSRTRLKWLSMHTFFLLFILISEIFDATYILPPR